MCAAPTQEVNEKEEWACLLSQLLVHLSEAGVGVATIARAGLSCLARQRLLRVLTYSLHDSD